MDMHEGVSFHQFLGCLSKIMLRLAIKESPKLPLITTRTTSHKYWSRDIIMNSCGFIEDCLLVRGGMS